MNEKKEVKTHTITIEIPAKLYKVIREEAKKHNGEVIDILKETLVGAFTNLHDEICAMHCAGEILIGMAENPNIDTEDLRTEIKDLIVFNKGFIIARQLDDEEQTGFVNYHKSLSNIGENYLENVYPRLPELIK